jgi:UDP-N-acetylmuramate: L-alanyl-gamma-D-glutamyl-meso-diaminopimelate ligase
MSRRWACRSTAASIHGAAGHDQTSLAEIIDRIRAAGVKAAPVGTPEAAWDARGGLCGNEAVLLMSSGPLMGLPDALPVRFDTRYAR